MRIETHSFCRESKSNCLALILTFCALFALASCSTAQQVDTPTMKLWREANAAEMTGHHEVAVEAAKHYLKLRPESPSMHWLLARNLLELQDPDSIVSFKRAIQLAPGDAGVRAGYCYAKLVLRIDDFLLEDCRKGVELSPDDHWANWSLAMAFVELGLETEAQRLFRQAIQTVEPYQGGRDFNLARLSRMEVVASDAARWTRAKAWIETIWPAKPATEWVDKKANDARYQEQTVRSGTPAFYLENGDFVGALTLSERMLIADSDDQQALRLRLDALLGMKRHVDAAHAYSELLERTPNDGGIWSDYCWQLILIGREDEAAYACRNASAFEPDNSHAWINSGHVYLLRGEVDKAYAHYRYGLATPLWAKDTPQRMFEAINEDLTVFIEQGRQVDVARSAIRWLASEWATVGPILEARSKIWKRLNTNKEATPFETVQFWEREVDQASQLLVADHWLIPIQQWGLVKAHGDANDVGDLRRISMSAALGIQRHFGASRQLKLVAVNAQARLHYANGNNEVALKLRSQSLADFGRPYGGESFLVAMALVSSASDLGIDNPVSAKLLLSQAKAQRPQLWGDRGINLSREIASYEAASFVLEQDADAAAKVLDDIHRSELSRWGRGHPNLLPSLGKVADLYMAAGLFERALQAVETAVSIIEFHFGEGDHELIGWLVRQANIEQQLGQKDLAKHRLIRAQALTGKSGADKSGHQLMIWFLLAQLEASDNPNAAIRLLSSARALVQAQAGDDETIALLDFLRYYLQLENGLLEFSQPGIRDLRRAAARLGNSREGPVLALLVDFADLALQIDTAEPSESDTIRASRLLADSFKRLETYPATSPDVLYGRARVGFLVMRAMAGGRFFKDLSNDERTALALWHGKRAASLVALQRHNNRELRAQFKASLFQGQDARFKSDFEYLANLLVKQGRLGEAETVMSMLKARELGAVPTRTGTLRRGLDETATEQCMTKAHAKLVERGLADAAERTELEAKQKASQLTTTEAHRLQQLMKASESWIAEFERFAQHVKCPSRKVDGGMEQAGAAVAALQGQSGAMQAIAARAPGTVALQYIVTPESISIIVSTPHASFGRSSAVVKGELNDLIHRFRSATTSQQENLTVARKLYALLIGPVAQELADAKVTTLALSLSGALRYLPFAALHDGQQFLIERYALVQVSPYMPGTSTTASSTPRVAAMGVTKARLGYEPLPSVAGELEAIVAPADAPANGRLPGSLHLDQAFTEDRLREALRGGYTVVHLASHFDYSPANVNKSVLLPGAGDPISVPRMQSWTWNGLDLLVLSACNTASGSAPGQSGEEVETLSTKLQLRQVRTVMATLWQVNDRSTAELMKRFYANWTQGPGMTRAKALQLAQISMLKGEGLDAMDSAQGPGTQRASAPNPNSVRSAPAAAGWTHPYHWASFTLSGHWGL